MLAEPRYTFVFMADDHFLLPPDGFITLSSSIGLNYALILSTLQRARGILLTAELAHLVSLKALADRERVHHG